jgi:hypothetical protein
MFRYVERITESVGLLVDNWLIIGPMMLLLFFMDRDASVVDLCSTNGHTVGSVASDSMFGTKHTRILSSTASLLAVTDGRGVIYLSNHHRAEAGALRAAQKTQRNTQRLALLRPRKSSKTRKKLAKNSQKTCKTLPATMRKGVSCRCDFAMVSIARLFLYRAGMQLRAATKHNETRSGWHCCALENVANYSQKTCKKLAKNLQKTCKKKSQKTCKIFAKHCPQQCEKV